MTDMLYPVLETERLRLEPISQAHSDFIVQHFLNPIVQRFLYDAEPMTQPEEALGIIDFYLNATNDSYNRWVVVRKADNTPLGTCGFHKWDKAHRRNEIGYDLSPQFHGQGYMREALKACLSHAFRRLQVHRVDAFVATDNERSLHLLERLGFKREGLLRDYFWSGGVGYDHYILGLLKSDADWLEAEQV